MSPSNTEHHDFVVGPICFQRSEIFHKLHHLKWMLLQRVKSKVTKWRRKGLKKSDPIFGELLEEEFNVEVSILIINVAMWAALSFPSMYINFIHPFKK